MVAPSHLVLILLVAVHSGEALKCFECNSKNDTACANEVPPDSFKKDCSEHVEGHKYKLCRKVIQIIEYEVNGLKPDTRVIRSCGWDDSSYLRSCYQRSGFGGRQEVCTCTTDFCNSSSTITIATMLIASLVFLLRLL